MDFFSQNEASQLVKTALNAGALKLNGVSASLEVSEAAAKADAAYMLALYRELLGPDGAAATMEDTQAQAAQQQQIQAAMQQAIATAQQAQPVQQAAQSMQQAQPVQQQAQPMQQAQPAQQQAQPAQQAPQQQQQQQFQPPAGAQGGGQGDYRQYVPESARHFLPPEGQVQGQG